MLAQSAAWRRVDKGREEGKECDVLPHDRRHSSFPPTVSRVITVFSANRMLSEPVGGEPQLKLAAGLFTRSCRCRRSPSAPGSRRFAPRRKRTRFANRPPVPLKVMVGQRSKVNLASTTVFTFFNQWSKTIKNQEYSDAKLAGQPI